MQERVSVGASLLLFAGLGRSELRQLACCFDEVVLAPGMVLSAPGRYQAALYILIDAAVSISDATGRRTFVRLPGRPPSRSAPAERSS